MQDSIQTTGGVLHPSDIEFINNCICEVFGCEPWEISDLQPLQKDLISKGSHSNIKITEKEDVDMFLGYLLAKEYKEKLPR